MMRYPRAVLVAVYQDQNQSNLLVKCTLMRDESRPFEWDRVLNANKEWIICFRAMLAMCLHFDCFDTLWGKAA